MMSNDVWKGGGALQPNDEVGDVLKHGTLGIGFIGGHNAMVAIYGEGHATSKEAWQTLYDAVLTMNRVVEEYKARYGLNYSVLATPAEGLSGRFTRMDRKRYGEIPGVTDRDYYTNSFHVPVYYPISAFEKIKKEAPFHALTNAGHISYVELDGDTSRNLPAFESIIRYMKEQGVADEMLIGPEFEFHLFDNVSYTVSPQKTSFTIDTEQAAWNSGKESPYNNGFQVPAGGGYHVAAPQDIAYNLRSQMCILLENWGVDVKYHHHEVGGSGQMEIEVELGDMVDMADKTMIIKYVIRNAAVKAGKTATFMPKPIHHEAGNGMHVHMLLKKDGKPVVDTNFNKEVILTKKDAQTSDIWEKVLTGAEYTAYHVGTDGKKYYYTYHVSEMKVDGYTTEITYKGDRQYSITVTNTKNWFDSLLPETGGMGKALLYTLGVLLLCLVTATEYRKRKSTRSQSSYK